MTTQTTYHTVILINPDYMADQYGDDYTLCRTATKLDPLVDMGDPAVLAIAQAQDEAAKANPQVTGVSPNDFAAVAVFEGWHELLATDVNIDEGVLC